MKNLGTEIEEIKIKLNDVVSEKDYNLLDKKVIEVSKAIDKLIVQYHSLD